MAMAVRTLKFKQGQMEKTIDVRLFQPTPGPDGGWFLRYEIGWPHGLRQGEGWGVDAVQAVLMTMQAIGTELYTSPYHESGQLVWEQPGKGYGFLVPHNVRDLLVGDDALYGF